MEDQQPGKPIKVKFSDKRRVGDRDLATSGASSSGSPLRSAPEEAAGSADSSSASRPATTTPPPPDPYSNASESSDSVESGEDQNGAEQAPDYLEDLRRVQADFDNYRKRMLREQTQLAQRASARMIERLLPILDNLESAISHGEGGAGVELVHKELRRMLQEEGLEEIAAEGQPFDPRMHEAFEAVEDDGVAEPTVRSVLRRGYAFKGQVLRAPMVSVARPPEKEPDAAAEDAEPDAAEG